MLETLGFKPVARHRSREVLLYRQGAMNIVVNAHAGLVQSTAALDKDNAGHPRITAMALREARELFEREYLVAQINRFGGNISRTAQFVGMERSALHRKLKSLGVVGGMRGEDELMMGK